MASSAGPASAREDRAGSRSVRRSTWRPGRWWTPVAPPLVVMTSLNAARRWSGAFTGPAQGALSCVGQQIRCLYRIAFN